MPSWRLHEKYATLINIPKDLAKLANKLIDTILHDFGRKLPNKKYTKRLLDDLGISYLYIGIEEQEWATEYLKTIILGTLFTKGGDKGYEAFMLHHYLDFFEDLTKCELLLNEEMNETLFTKTLREDLKYVSHQVGIPSKIIERIEEIEKHFHQVKKDIINEIKPKLNIKRELDFKELIHEKYKKYEKGYQKKKQNKRRFLKVFGIADKELCEAEPKKWRKGMTRKDFITAFVWKEKIYEKIRIKGNHIGRTTFRLKELRNKLHKITIEYIKSKIYYDTKYETNLKHLVTNLTYIGLSQEELTEIAQNFIQILKNLNEQTLKLLY